MVKNDPSISLIDNDELTQQVIAGGYFRHLGHTYG
jgi:hypothetical protein